MINTQSTKGNNAMLNRMGNQECEQIHMASLEILERVGIDTHHEKARNILVKAGAKVDGIRIRIPAHMVARALSTAPKRMLIHNHDGDVAMRAYGANTYYGGGSDCLNILDHRIGKRRRAIYQDVVDAQILMDALQEIDFVMSAFLPSDVESKIYPQTQMEAMLNNTTKPIIFVAPDFESSVDCVKMCEIVAGGERAFQERPFAVCYINVTSGLVANRDSLKKCIYFAQKGLPQLYIPLNAGGVNSPNSTAGCMAALNAGTLLGIVLSQLVRAGSPIGVPGWSGGPYNLQTMVGSYCLADEQGVATAMGKYYRLPVFGLAGSTDSKALDQQAGAECALGLLISRLNGENIVHDLGFMDAGLQGSLQLIAISNDLLGWIRAATSKVVVNDETLALDVIEELGPTGNYLEHAHTYKHFREAHYSKLADRNIFSNWQDKGSQTMAERSAQQVDKILKEHKPRVLPRDIQKALSKFSHIK